MNKLSVKSWLSNIISESEVKKEAMPKFSSDNVDSVSTVKITPDKGVMVIGFLTRDGKNAQLKTKATNFYKWIKLGNNSEENPSTGFLKWFLEKHQPSESKMMSEIVDEYNGLIGDEDLPADTSRMVGLSSKDSTQATYQTLAKGWNNFNTGAISGFISW